MNLTSTQRKLLLSSIKLLGMIDAKQMEVTCVRQWRNSIFFSYEPDENRIHICELQLSRLIKMYNNIAYRILENPIQTETLLKIQK